VNAVDAKHRPPILVVHVVVGGSGSHPLILHAPALAQRALPRVRHRLSALQRRHCRALVVVELVCRAPARKARRFARYSLDLLLALDLLLILGFFHRCRNDRELLLRCRLDLDNFCLIFDRRPILGPRLVFAPDGLVAHAAAVSETSMSLGHFGAFFEIAVQMLALTRRQLLLAATSPATGYALQPFLLLLPAHASQVLGGHAKCWRELLHLDVRIVRESKNCNVPRESLLGAEAADERSTDVDNRQVVVPFHATIATEPARSSTERFIIHERK